jgi:hypothetical protein
MEEDLGRSINAVMDGDNYSWYHLLLNIEGVTMEFAHHISLGAAPWTKLSSPSRIANETILQYYNSFQTVPNLVIRSHKHRYADTFNNYRTRVIVTPAWQLTTAYVYTFSPASIADIGGLHILLDEGNYDVNVIRYHAQPKQAWTDDDNRTGTDFSVEIGIPGDKQQRHDLAGTSGTTRLESGQGETISSGTEIPGETLRYFRSGD